MKTFEGKFARVKQLMEKLIDRCCDGQYYVSRPIAEGGQYPDRWLPGRLIERLSKEDRELLKLLSSDMINDRQD